MAYQSNTIQGWMGAGELVWLYEKAATMKSVVEIGSWRGRSTHALLSGCPGLVFAVDHFLGNPDQRNGPHKEATTRDISLDFWANVGHFKNLVMMRMESTEAAQYFKPGSIDMVFIDGCHTKEAVLRDLMAWKPICGKLLCGHDIGEGGVQRALECMNIQYTREAGCIWSAEI